MSNWLNKWGSDDPLYLWGTELQSLLSLAFDIWNSCGQWPQWPSGAAFSGPGQERQSKPLGWRPAWCSFGSHPSSLLISSSGTSVYPAVCPHCSTHRSQLFVVKFHVNKMLIRSCSLQSNLERWSWGSCPLQKLSLGLYNMCCFQ